MPIDRIASAGIESGGVASTNLASGVPTRAQLPAGSVLQVVNVQSGSFASTTNVIPTDNTIPQNTEGAEYFTLSITPTSATSKLLIQIVAQTAPIGAAWITVALFQDSNANALAVASTYQSISTAASTQTVNYHMTSGTTSATTFKMRYGPTGNTATINGSGSPIFNGTWITSMTITEIAA
jgi:hypothetical protein